MKHKTLKKAVTGIALFLLIIILAGIVSLFASYKLLTISSYSVSHQKLLQNINAVVISDLHGSGFGKENKRLVNKIAKLDPDVIFTVGDMLNNNTEDLSALDSLYEDLAQIAPVYSSLGNHEIAHPRRSEIEDIFRKHSTFLHNEYKEITINGTNIRIGALAAYHPSFEDLNEYLRDFADTDKFTLLLSHCPEYYFWGINKVKIDLMLSGHSHGGQVIVPFKGGLFAPEQGWWPKYDYGVFHEEMATLVVTRGLGSSKQKAPRFNNPPEILSLTLSPEADYE